MLALQRIRTCLESYFLNDGNCDCSSTSRCSTNVRVLNRGGKEGGNGIPGGTMIAITLEGRPVGVLVGAVVGSEVVGEGVGFSVGDGEGLSGAFVGALVGKLVGAIVGTSGKLHKHVQVHTGKLKERIEVSRHWQKMGRHLDIAVLSTRAYLVSLGSRLNVVVLVMVGTIDPRLDWRLRCISRYQFASSGEYCITLSSTPRINSEYPNTKKATTSRNNILKY